MKKLFLLSLSCFILVIANVNAGAEAPVTQNVENNNANVVQNSPNNQKYHTGLKPTHVAKPQSFQDRACENIISECKKLGFIVGEYKQDNGLWKDCFDPILDGKPVTQKGKTIAVPVKKEEVAACKEERRHQKSKK